MIDRMFLGLKKVDKTILRHDLGLGESNISFPRALPTLPNCELLKALASCRRCSGGQCTLAIVFHESQTSVETTKLSAVAAAALTKTHTSTNLNLKIEFHFSA